MNRRSGASGFFSLGAWREMKSLRVLRAGNRDDTMTVRGRQDVARGVKFITIIAVLSALMFSAGSMQARGAVPPPRLMDIFQNLSSVEAKFKTGRWHDAIEATTGVLTTYKEILPELKKTVKVDIEADFTSRLMGLRQSLEKKDLRQAERNYIDLHKMIFALLDNYEFKVPPIMMIIDKYIDEAREAAEKRDFKRVVSEMNEVEDFFYQAGQDLSGQHASLVDIEEFKSTVREVREAGKTGSKPKVLSGVAKLKMLSARFIKLF